MIVREIGVRELQERGTRSSLVLDVRSPEEFALSAAGAQAWSLAGGTQAWLAAASPMVHGIERR
ncbi:hypothetical protein [Dactylosporangium salmoneum]|uniref:hypothetical protein n=1 Tax=Dactylosporangium salmoneum TaxID=53361 RepID=UPI0031CF795E